MSERRSPAAAPPAWASGAALAVPGVKHVVELAPAAPSVDMPHARVAGGVAVVATNTWAALEGRRKLAVRWRSGSHAGESSATYRQQMVAALGNAGQEMVHSAGEPDAQLARAKTVHRADYSFPVGEDVGGKLSGEFAHQTNYAGNPLSISLNYWLGEGSVSYKGLTGLIGYEVLEGNGTIGFATPLATLHAFNGWADMFLTTPANGLKDFYLKAAYVLPADFIEMRSLTATAFYHDFTTDNLSQGIGSEWDASLELAVDPQTSLLAKYAAYRGAGVTFGGFPDKSIVWLQLAYKY